jgi:hypothetical protein
MSLKNPETARVARDCLVIAGERVIYSARLHSRTMNKIVVVRPACRAVVHGSAGLPTGQRVKRRLQMHLASPTSPAHVGVSSEIMKKSFSATCQVRSLTSQRTWYRGGKPR